MIFFNTEDTNSIRVTSVKIIQLFLFYTFCADALGNIMKLSLNLECIFNERQPYEKNRNFEVLRKCFDTPTDTRDESVSSTGTGIVNVLGMPECIISETILGKRYL